MASYSEKRKHPRVPRSEVLNLTWTDPQGRYYRARARCIDSSEKGLNLEVNQRIDSSCYVNIRAEQCGLAASAQVRRCIQKGLKYRVGLEFGPGARWEHLRVPVGAPAR